MTMISGYLRMEVVDRSEPVNFYVPGADDWTDPLLGLLRSRRVARGSDDEVYLMEDEDELFG